MSGRTTVEPAPKDRVMAKASGMTGEVWVTVIGAFSRRPSHYLLSKDEAVHLANRLTDAVDELELAEAVSGCNHQGNLRCTACADWAVSGS